MVKVVIGYLVLINVVAFILYGVDKAKAKAGSWRISEKVLLGIAAFGGSIGAIAGMLFFHHKTQHPQFKIGLPVILAVQIIVFLFMPVK